MRAARRETARCHVCNRTAREGKRACIEHLATLDHVADLLLEIDLREAEAARAMRGRVPLNGRLARELQSYIERLGTRTLARVASDLGWDIRVVVAVGRALCRRGRAVSSQGRRGPRIGPARRVS